MDRTEIKKTVTFIEKAHKEHIVYGIVYEPEIEDTQGDSATIDEIEKACHGFMLDYQNYNIEHEDSLTQAVKVIESYIAPVDFLLGSQQVKKGSWVLASKVLNNELWDAIEKGEISGYSMEGTAVRE